MRCLLHYGPELTQYFQSYRSLCVLYCHYQSTGGIDALIVNLIAQHEPMVAEELCRSAVLIGRDQGYGVLTFDMRPSDTTYLEYVDVLNDERQIADAIDLDDVLALSLTAFARLNLPSDLASLSMRLGGPSDHICEARVLDIVENIMSITNEPCRIVLADKSAESKPE